jgi:hypothetical protein
MSSVPTTSPTLFPTVKGSDLRITLPKCRINVTHHGYYAGCGDSAYPLNEFYITSNQTVTIELNAAMNYFVIFPAANMTIYIMNFRTASDRLDLSNFPSSENIKLSSLSYSAPPLILHLPNQQYINLLSLTSWNNVSKSNFIFSSSSNSNSHENKSQSESKIVMNSILSNFISLFRGNVLAVFLILFFTTLTVFLCCRCGSKVTRKDLREQLVKKQEELPLFHRPAMIVPRQVHPSPASVAESKSSGASVAPTKTVLPPIQEDFIESVVLQTQLSTPFGGLLDSTSGKLSSNSSSFILNLESTRMNNDFPTIFRMDRSLSFMEANILESPSPIETLLKPIESQSNIQNDQQSSAQLSSSASSKSKSINSSSSNDSSSAYSDVSEDELFGIESVHSLSFSFLPVDNIEEYENDEEGDSNTSNTVNTDDYFNNEDLYSHNDHDDSTLSLSMQSIVESGSAEVPFSGTTTN